MGKSKREIPHFLNENTMQKRYEMMQLQDQISEQIFQVL